MSTCAKNKPTKQLIDRAQLWSVTFQDPSDPLRSRFTKVYYLPSCEEAIRQFMYAQFTIIKMGRILTINSETVMCYLFMLKSDTKKYYIECLRDEDMYTTFCKYYIQAEQQDIIGIQSEEEEEEEETIKHNSRKRSLSPTPPVPIQQQQQLEQDQQQERDSPLPPSPKAQKLSTAYVAAAAVVVPSTIAPRV
jgi:hypothetical protein